MSEITLFTGEKTLVDDEDYERLVKHKWYILKQNKNQYARAYINGKHVRMHRFILNAIDPKIYIDHKDRDGLNNRKSNIRICTPSDNMRNRRTYGSSKFTGVSKHGNGWLVHINTNGKSTHVGWFKNEIEAALAYNEAALKSGNPFFRLNEIK